MELVTSGKVTLFTFLSEAYTPNMTTAEGNFGHFGGYSRDITYYYLLREGEDQVTHLGSTDIFSKNFKKAGSDYFADCPELVEKIQNKEYKKKHLEKVVRYYNKNCK